MTRAPSGYAATDGAAYERFLGRWTRRLGDTLVVFADLPQDGPILDVGCGTGSLVAALRSAGPSRPVTGVDIAGAYLAYARTRKDCEGAVFLEMDAMDLDFAPGSFAAALSTIVLNFVPDPLAAVMRMREVVRPGGVLASAVWDFRGGLVYQRMLWDTIASIDSRAAATRDRIFSTPLGLPDGLLNLWREAGLQDVRRYSLTIRMDFLDFADYWEPLLGGQGPVGGYVASLDGDMRARVRDAVNAAYLSGAADGPRSLTATAWAVCGSVPG